ncbi:MAG TPA: prolyl oligopeptidase family serine peptidase [Planctomycetaceae bacterium]|nr:prolyl oligopeptidase family serine peptidase [Planctomycetaceae bacterium]
MAISVDCPGCGRTYNLNEKYAGKKVRCTDCKTAMQVPAAEAEEVATAFDSWDEEESAPAPKRKTISRRSAVAQDDDDSEHDFETTESHRVPSKAKPARKKKKKRKSGSGLKLPTEFTVGHFCGLLAILFLCCVPVMFFGMVPALVCVLGWMIAWVIALLVAAIWLLVIAFQEDAICGLLCIFVPFYQLYFIISRWSLTYRPIAVFGTTYGLACCCVGLANMIWSGGAAAGPSAPAAAAVVNAADAGEPFPVATIPVPLMPKFEQKHGLQITGYSGDDLRVPGALTSLHVHMPPGDYEDHSLPCVLIAPAGSNLLTGMHETMDDHVEQMPYLNAGYVVVGYSLDGAVSPNASDQDMAFAYSHFAGACAGLVNARNALEFVLARIPSVDPERIYVAGHSSAGTLALLFAEHEPRIKGCIAYAPAADVETRLAPVLNDRNSVRLLKGVQAFAKRSSPKTHAARMNCPVFLFHARDDSNVPISDTRAFAQLLQTSGKQAVMFEVATGDHYDSMIQQGIPQGIAWLQTLPGNESAGLAAAPTMAPRSQPQMQPPMNPQPGPPGFNPQPPPGPRPAGFPPPRGPHSGR